MKNVVRISSVLFICFTILLTGCHKEGKGGKASINGKAAHHGLPIPNCVIYIKYGATDLPGTSPSSFDDNVVCDAGGNYEFKDLYKGDYYLYGIGYDDAIMEEVRGGIGIDIKKNKAYTLEVPVTE